MTASAQTVVTGLGIVAPNGIGTADYWAATQAGRSGIGEIRRPDTVGYPVRCAGEVPADVPVTSLPSRLRVQTDRWTHLALYAADLALADAGLEPASLPDYEFGVVTASASGGNEFGQREIQRLWSQGPEFVGTYQSIAWFYAATTGQLSIRHGLRGPCGVVVSEQSGGLDALAHARRAVRRGTRAVLTGGTEAALSPYAFVCLFASGLLTRAADPTCAYRPFEPDADGYVPGEGGAILVVEEAAAAAARGATPYGFVAGHAATFDPPPGSSRPSGLRRAVELALADAGIGPTEVDVVFADAAGTPRLDEVEAAALAAVFGPFGVPVTAPKTMVGRLAAGGAALDVATALLSLRDQAIPPTVGTRRVADGYRLDLVLDEPRPARLRTAMVLARGFGGFNAAAVLRAPDPHLPSR